MHQCDEAPWCLRERKKKERLHKICQFQPEKPFNKILNPETLVGWRRVWSSDSNIKDET